MNEKQDVSNLQCMD